ncbi:uncharacterized protein LOC144356668 [Saccoglossus kowalevskii]
MISPRTRPVLVFYGLLLILQRGFSEGLDDLMETCASEVAALRQCASRSGGFTARFTTLGTYGRFGPTSLGDHYSGQDHEHLVRLNDGIQVFTVPHSSDYIIEAAGV